MNTSYQGAPATKFWVAVLTLILVASVIMAGCGGGEQQKKPSQGSKDTSQGSKAQTKNQESTTKKAANRESLSGTVVDNLPDKYRVIITPDWKGLKKDKVVKFKYKPNNVEVTLQGEQADPDDISVGQQATVKYVKKKTKNGNEVNIARSIQATVNKESLSGTVVDNLPDNDEFIIRTTGDEVVNFQYTPDDIDVTLQGEQADLDAISVGQQATVSYVKTIKNGREVNIARSIWLQPGSGATQGNESTG